VTVPTRHATSTLEALWKERRSYSRYEALLDLIQLAARRMHTVVAGPGPVTVQRGELVTSERILADRWRWSRKSVVTFLAYLRSSGELLTARLPGTKTGAGAKLTLIHYDNYVRRGAKWSQARSQDGGQDNGGSPRDLGPPRGPSPEPSAEPQTPSSSPAVLRSLSSPTPQTFEGGAGGGDASALAKNRGNGPADPELIAYTEELVNRLNAAQLQHYAIDAESYRPLRVHHIKTLEAALAMKNAGVPVKWASDYVWLEGQRYKPTPDAPQIASLAYFRRLIPDWRAVEKLRHSRAAAAENLRGGPGGGGELGQQVAHRERRGGTPERVDAIAGDVLKQFSSTWRAAMKPRDDQPPPTAGG
jgi:hypothetical protein